jgi:CheY-like chemotaxis protein
MFARYLLDAARERGMKGITTSLGVTALALAAEYKPAAVTLDIHLPDIAGWRVLDRLKNDPQMRHVPVAVISTDDARERALESGAFAFLAKPVPDEAHVDALLQKIRRFVERERRTLLAVSSDPSRLEWFATYLGGDDVGVPACPTFRRRALMADKPIDALLWDAGMRVADADLRPISTDDDRRRASGRAVRRARRRGDARRVALARPPHGRPRGEHAQRCSTRPRSFSTGIPSACPRRIASCCPGCTGARSAGGPSRDGRRRRHAQHLRARRCSRTRAWDRRARNGRGDRASLAAGTPVDVI